MRAHVITTTLAAGIVAMISVGCSATREHVAKQTDAPADRILVDVAGQPSSSPESSNNQRPKNDIRHVVYQDDRVDPLGDEGELLPPPESDDEGENDSAANEFDASVASSELPVADDSVSGLTLEAFEQMALQNNPSIQQASAAANKAFGIRKQVGLKPNPTIAYSGQEMGNEGAGGQQGAYISQTFVRGNKLALNQHILDHDVQSVLWQVEAQRYRVRTDIRTRFYAALGAQKQIALARAFRTVAQKGVTIAEERLQAQVGTRPDILQSEIQVSEVELTIQRAEFDFEAAWQELAAVAGVPYLPPSTILGSFPSNTSPRDMDSAHSLIVAESPLLKSANERVKRAQVNLHRQQVQATPNVTYQVGAARDNATGSEVVNLQVSLPLPVHNTNQGNIQAAHAEYCQATQNVQRISMQIRRNLAQVMRDYKTAAATVERYESTIIPKAKESLELILNAQAAGEIEFLRVLTARRMFFDVNLKYVSALAELSQANARIDGLLLTGGLSNIVSYDGGDDLRGQALNGQ